MLFCLPRIKSYFPTIYLLIRSFIADCSSKILRRFTRTVWLFCSFLGMYVLLECKTDELDHIFKFFEYVKSYINIIHISFDFFFWIFFQNKNNQNDFMYNPTRLKIIKNCFKLFNNNHHNCL